MWWQNYEKFWISKITSGILHSNTMAAKLVQNNSGHFPEFHPNLSCDHTLYFITDFMHGHTEWLSQKNVKLNMPCFQLHSNTTLLHFHFLSNEILSLNRRQHRDMKTVCALISTVDENFPWLIVFSRTVFGLTNKSWYIDAFDHSCFLIFSNLLTNISLLNIWLG